MAPSPKKLTYWVNGAWRTSKTTRYMDCFNPSTGEVIAQAPQRTAEEVREAIAAAATAFPAWSNTPPNKWAQVLFGMNALMDAHLEELTLILAAENGKVWDEAMGDVLKMTEVVELACGIPHLMKGPASMNATAGYDTTPRARCGSWSFGPRQTHLRGRGSQQQASPGAHRGQEPRPRAAGRRSRANGGGDRELRLRTRWSRSWPR